MDPLQTETETETDPDPKPIRALLRRLGEVNVPRGDGLTFVMFAAVAVFLAINEAFTGVLLALYYRPTVADANGSVRLIVTDVEFGGLVRSLHYWGAQALLFVLGATIAWAALRRAYRSPNAFAWFSGISLTLVAVAETLTGSLLPWSHRSEVEAQLSATLAAQIPLVGTLLRGLMLGGAEASDLSLVRILGVHAGALPIVATLCAGMLTLHTAGCAPRKPTSATLPLMPHVVLRAALAAAVAGMVLFALSSFFPPRLGLSANLATASAAGMKPSWYLVFVDQMLRAAPPRMLGVASARVIATAVALCIAALAVFPTFDRKASRGGQAVVLVVLAAILGGTIRALFI